MAKLVLYTSGIPQQSLDHVAHTLRSEDDILKSGYEVIQSDTSTN